MTLAGLALRRVTVVTSRARVDVALPVEATLAELIPQLVQMTGGDSGSEHLGRVWGLSRLNEPALSSRLTVSQAGLADGDVVYLRAVDQATGPKLFDDVVDAIAQSASSRTGMWRASVARRTALATAIAAAIGSALLAQVDTTRGLAIGVPAAVAVLLLVAALVLSRSWGDRLAATGAVLAGLVPAAVAGQRSVSATFWPVTGNGLCLALAALTVYAIVGFVVVGRAYGLFTAVIVAGAVGAVACSVERLLPARPTSVAAVVIALATLLSTAAPMLAARLARLPMPRVPADAAQFRVDQDDPSEIDVPTVAGDTQRILAGLVGALGLAVVVSAAVLALGSSSRWALLTVGAVGLAWVGRSRGYRSAAQRIIVLVCGLVPIALLGVRLPDQLDGRTWPLAAAALCAAVVAGCLFYMVRQSLGRGSPYWGRAFDVTEYLALIALVPLCGAVIGVYSTLRHLGS